MSLVPSHVELDDDAAALIAAAREYARSELLACDRQWDRGSSTVADILPQLGEMGLMTLMLPEELDGVACSYATYAAILHEISACSPATCVTIGVHCMVGAILSRYASKDLRAKLLPTWGEPQSFAAFALSEAGAGSDAAGVACRVDPVDGGYLINGEKMWITNGITGRWLFTLARLPDTKGRDGLCGFLVDGNHEGVARTEIEGKMGLRGSETAVISYHDVFVPADHLIGELGKGLDVFLSCLNQGRVGIASQATGIAEACVDEMISYANQREQFGRPIGRFQAVANMIADSATELEASKALVWRAARQIDLGEVDWLASSMAKLYATEAANRIAYRAVQVHGGAGYVNECRVEQLYRDVRVTTIYEGTSEVQRIVLAKALLKC